MIRPDEEVSLSLSELDHILGLQRSICSLIASDTPYLDVITETCRMAERLLPGAVASFMQLDAHSQVMNVVSAPSIPADGVSRLCGLKPGPGGGSCGNAVHGNAPVFVYNTFTDPRWSDLRNLARDFNLCSERPRGNRRLGAPG